MFYLLQFYQDPLSYLVIWGNAVLPAGLLGLQQRGQGNVILGHHSVEHILVTIGVLYGKLVELDKLLLKFIHMYICTGCPKKNALLCLTGHRGHQKWTRDKSRVSFAKFKKFPF